MIGEEKLAVARAKWPQVDALFSDATIEAASERHKQQLTSAGGRIPKKFDARRKWPKCPSIRKIFDQAGCGSCWVS